MKPADPLKQRSAMRRKLERRMACEGKLMLPAVPSMLDDYTSRCAELFSALGRKLNDAELAHLRNILQAQLQQAFGVSPRSNIVVSYQAQVGGLLNYVIAPQHASLEETYATWVSTRKPPFFGVEPDAKVLAVARQLGEPSKNRVLDIGAGTGRNALALARMGCGVDAVELTPKFAELLSTAARAESLSVRVICKDAFDIQTEIGDGYALILLSEVVSDFRSTAQLRALFEMADRRLAPGGLLLINAFMPRPHYSADDAAREFAQQVYSSFFTHEELLGALRGLGLEPVSDESVYDYERAHLPEGAWPPTSWYPEWVSGLDVFEVPLGDAPVELRWLAFKKAEPSA